MAWPREPRPLRAFYSISEPAAVGETSGFSIEAPSAGNGLIMFLYAVTSGLARGGIIIEPATDPAILDTSVAVVPAAILSTFDPAQAATVVVNEGTSGGGVTPSRPNWLIFVGTQILTGTQRDEIYVPPGFRMTALKDSTNVSMIANIGLDEL